mmetsp:Transcript_18154/g.28318  ORF Transcript_18154/g.28318 Transcript_18154/m.28318 type:complete len:241 (-) Transcript_18154:609-1331(-)
MGFPAEEDDRLVALAQPLDLRQHPLFRALNQLETLEAESISFDHVQDQTVAVIARLDAENLGVQRIGIGGQIGKITYAKGRSCGVGGQRVFGTLKVHAHRLDGACLAVGRDIGLHRGHPVAQEHIHVAFGERDIGDGHRQHFDFSVIPQRFQHHSRCGGGGGDVCPTHIRECDGATVGKGRARRRDGQNGQAVAKFHFVSPLESVWACAGPDHPSSSRDRSDKSQRPPCFSAPDRIHHTA